MDERDERIHSAKCIEAAAWPAGWMVDGTGDWDVGPIPTLTAYRDEDMDDPLVIVEIVFDDEGTITYLVHSALHLDDVEPVATREAAMARYDEVVGASRS